jgi:hypothetical protein
MQVGLQGLPPFLTACLVIVISNVLKILSRKLIELTSKKKKLIEGKKKKNLLRAKAPYQVVENMSK